MRLTQKERLLALLKNRGEVGVKVYELMTPKPEGLGIAQYGARILELREEGHDIVNIKEGHFVLKTSADEAAQTIINAMDTTPKPQINGYERFQQIGMKLKSEVSKTKPEQVQLEEKIAAAEKWMEINKDKMTPKAYEVSLQRYEQLVDQLDNLTNQKSFF